MKLEKLIRFIETFRQVDQEIPFSQALILVVVAKSGDDGISLTEIAKSKNMGLSTVSRHVAALGKINRHHEPGFDLLQSCENVMERRKKVITLTPKGKMLINSLLNLFV